MDDIGLAKKFVWAFLYYLIGNPKRTFLAKKKMITYEIIGSKYWLSLILDTRQSQLRLLIQKIGQMFDIWLHFFIPRMMS